MLKKNGAFYVRQMEDDPSVYGMQKAKTEKEDKSNEKEYFNTKKKKSNFDDFRNSVNITIKWNEALRQK